MDDAPDPERNPWRARGVREVYDNPWITVREHDVLDASGTPRAYGVVSFKKIAVGVLPVHADGTVTLVGQYRFPLSAYSWEMPEGGSEPGHTAEETAVRELKEESGLVAGTMREILRMHLSNSVSDEAAVIFLATDLTEGAPDPDDDEVLRIARVPFMQLMERALAGEITDSLTVAGALRAHHMAVTGALDSALAAAMLGRPEGDR